MRTISATSCHEDCIVRYLGFPTAIMTLLAGGSIALTNPWKHITERGKTAGIHSGPSRTRTTSGDRADRLKQAGVATIEIIRMDWTTPFLISSTSSLIRAIVGKSTLFRVQAIGSPMGLPKLTATKNMPKLGTPRDTPC